MTTRSTSSEYQPLPPSYALKSTGTVGNSGPKMGVILESSTDGVQKGGNVGAAAPTSTVRTLSAKTSF